MAAQTRSATRLRFALFSGVGLAMTGLALVAYGTNLFKGLELSSVDVRFEIRGERPPPTDIVIVDIGADTFNDFNQRELRVRYPFPRGYFARIIDRLRVDGAKVIAYDIQFTEASEDPAQDEQLAFATLRAGNVVLTTTEVEEGGRTNVFGGDEAVRQVKARVGNANFPEDPGGVIRRVAYEVDELKSFSLVVAERVTGKTITQADFGDRNLNWIDFAGPTGTFKAYSFSDVHFGQFEPGTFRGKIVVVGLSAAPSLQDIHPTSIGEGMSGPELQANAIATALEAFPLQSLPASEADGGLGTFTILLIAGLALLAPIVSLRLNLLWTLVTAIVAAVGYLVVAQLAFNQGRILSFVYPFGALVLSSVGSLAAHYLLAAFERERVRDVFSRFVPESVVEQVLARTDDDLRLGGVTLTGSIMFTDLRGFTTFSESLPADRVIQAVNYYLSEMTDAIHAHEGTLVSYEGDGIMAVFGAPIEQEDHADRAVSTAREMLLVRLPRFNAWLREQDLGEGFKMGIGVNTGPFMSGNVGSQRRLEYTVIGDATNTASRLQGMTKGQAYLFYMADSTREALLEEVDDLVFVDEFEVRGRQEKVKIWSVEAANSEAFDAREAEVKGREKG
jgi:adenylate cyclase